ncbi:MAG TPA: LysR family transcriptional regulator [Dehalococcoidia bacterium]|nr:LysR family transcriptional regulator [Dehalococcoidia bacterium]
MDINLHQLHIFRAVADHGSYSRAAAALYLSQPGVSLQVKALEKSIGLPLFEKVGRTLHLTEAGRELLSYSERIFGLLEETRLVMEELGGGRRGTVKVAASTTAGIYIVPPALGAFHRESPGVKLTLDVVNRFTVQKRLLDNEVDLAVMGLIEDAHDLDIAEFVPNELVVIASPRHPLANEKNIPMQALSNETFLLREAGSGTRIDTTRLFEARDLKLNVGMELRSSGAIKQGVAADLGIAVIPLAAIELELLAGRLCVLDVEGFPVHRHWYLARRAGSHPSAAAAALWQFLLAYRKDIAAILNGVPSGTRSRATAGAKAAGNSL